MNNNIQLFVLDEHIELWYPDTRHAWEKNVSNFLSLLSPRLQALMIRKTSENKGVLTIPLLKEDTTFATPMLAIELEKKNDVWVFIRAGELCHRNFPKKTTHIDDPAYKHERQSYQKKFSAYLRHLIYDARARKGNVHILEWQYLRSTHTDLPKAFENIKFNMLKTYLQCVMREWVAPNNFNLEEHINRWWAQVYTLSEAHQNILLDNVLCSLQTTLHMESGTYSDIVHKWSQLWIMLAECKLRESSESAGIPENWHVDMPEKWNDTWQIWFHYKNDEDVDLEQCAYAIIQSDEIGFGIEKRISLYGAEKGSEFLQFLITSLEDINNYKKQDVHPTYTLLKNTAYTEQSEIPYWVSQWLEHDRIWQKYVRDYTTLMNTLLGEPLTLSYHIPIIPTEHFINIWFKYLQEVHQKPSNLIAQSLLTAQDESIIQEM